MLTLVYCHHLIAALKIKERYEAQAYRALDYLENFKNVIDLNYS